MEILCRSIVDHRKLNVTSLRPSVENTYKSDQFYKFYNYSFKSNLAFYVYFAIKNGSNNGQLKNVIQTWTSDNMNDIFNNKALGVGNSQA